MEDPKLGLPDAVTHVAEEHVDTAPKHPETEGNQGTHADEGAVMKKARTVVAVQPTGDNRAHGAADAPSSSTPQVIRVEC